ncbi:MAG: hypothetical protein LBT30_08295 [Clostridiales bacterium]|jgi:hypothetical protein|nr:hypothetical protein [Clostridiales bacterium]
MNDKKIKLKNQKEINISAAVASAVLVTISVFGFISFGTSRAPQALISALTVVLLALCMLFTAFYSYYSFADKYLYVNFGFFIFKIKYDDIKLLREDKESKTLFIVYLKNGDTENVKFLKILIDKSKNIPFITAVRNKNTLAIYELFDKNDEFKDDGNTNVK